MTVFVQALGEGRAVASAWVVLKGVIHRVVDLIATGLDRRADPCEQFLWAGAKPLAPGEKRPQKRTS